MNISGFTFAVIGASSQAFPLPSVALGTNQLQTTLAVCNCGTEAAYVETGPTLGVVATSSGTECGAGVCTLITLNAGDLAWAAISASSTPTAIAVGLGT